MCCSIFICCFNNDYVLLRSLMIAVQVQINSGGKDSSSGFHKMIIIISQPRPVVITTTLALSYK